ncbi:ATP-dependent RNA helicase, putative [Babesia ovata]|uniref:ATP-dependent RNA helicase, putative n=1 Tax=Babesia ovata TaxID=189622 RepID=A0A2H6KHQ2_9APIC|nr:ATP-dependent RNA helicase, putative [Babesia ovata]GBE62522.1 ATP-dependent RNA helicase, putative [Babesia ovata]
MAQVDAVGDPAAIEQEREMQRIDLERLFIDTDEMTVMKTLQNMHLANYQLENAMKDVMTQELEPMKLYSGNMLGLCSVVKEAQASLNDLAGQSRKFDLKRPSEYNTAKASEADTAKPTEAAFERQHSIGSDEDPQEKDDPPAAVPEEVENNDRRKDILESVHTLQNLSMENFRLLKRNMFLKSFKLIGMSPALISQVKQLVEPDAPADPQKADDAPKIEEPNSDSDKCDFIAHLESERQRLSGEMHRQQLQAMLDRIPSVVKYNTTLLLRKCEAALGSSSLETLVEASLCLLMQKGRYSQDPNRLWNNRLKALKDDTNKPAVGCIAGCEQVLSHQLASAMYTLFCRNMNPGALAILKRILGVATPDESDEIMPPKPAEYTNFMEESYWKEAIELIVGSVKKVELENIVDFNHRLHVIVVTVLKSVERNQLLMSVYSLLGLDLGQELLKACTVVLEKIKAACNEVASESTLKLVADIEQRLQAHEVCTAQIKALSNYASRGDSGVIDAFNARMSEVLNKWQTDARDMDGPAKGDGILGTYGEEGSVRVWLQKTGLGNVVLNAETMWPQMESAVRELLEVVATKCVMPLEGTDPVVRTLVGTGALCSQYSLLGATIFPIFIKKACIQHWMSNLDSIDEKDKAILVLCFRDSGLAGAAKDLADSCETVAEELGDEKIEEHAQVYQTVRNLI